MSMVWYLQDVEDIESKSKTKLRTRLHILTDRYN